MRRLPALVTAFACLAAIGGACSGCTPSSNAESAPSVDTSNPPEAGPLDAGLDAAEGMPTEAGSDVDNGQPSSVYPAFHPEIPQLASLGGPILASPVFVPVTYDGDSNRAAIEAFMEEVGGSTYWATVGADYGVGAGTAGTPVHVSDTVPTAMTDDQIPSVARQ